MGFTFFLCEIVIRKFSPEQTDSPLTRLIHASYDERKYTPKPNVSIEFYGIHTQLDIPVMWNINAEGFRSDKSLKKKSNNTLRMATYGDSEVFGWSVDFNDTFQEQIEELDKKLEVLNCGVPGYNIHQIAKHIERMNGLTNPDIILYIINPNDFDSPTTYNKSVANSKIVKIQLIRKLFIVYEFIKWKIDEKRRRSPKVINKFIEELINIKQFCEYNNTYLIIAFINSEDKFVLYKNEDLGNYFLETDSFSNHIVEISSATDSCEKIDLHYTKECHQLISVIIYNHLQKLKSL